MKKLALFLVVFFILTGCTAGNEKGSFSEKDAPGNAENFNEGEVLQRINEIKEGATPVVSGDKNSQTQAPPPVSTMTNTKRNPNNYPDLTKDFSQAVFKTNFGNFTVEFYTDESPKTVNNFLNLAKEGFYDNTRFHRVIKDFMIQGGDPQSNDPLKKNLWGTGDPGYKFADEFNNQPLQMGSFAMANSGPNTNGSQFFIVTTEFTPWLDGKHTNFGYVTLGMEVVEKIEAVDVEIPSNRPKEDVIIESIELLK